MGLNNENSNPLAKLNQICIHNLWASRELEMGWRAAGGASECLETVGLVESDRGRRSGEGLCGGE